MKNNFNIIEKNDYIIGFADDIISYIENIIETHKQESDVDTLEELNELIKTIKEHFIDELIKINITIMGEYQITKFIDIIPLF